MPDRALAVFNAPDHAPPVDRWREFCTSLPTTMEENAAPLPCDAPALAMAVSHHRDAHDQARTLGALDQRYEQLSAGPFKGSIQSAQVGGVAIFRERLAQSVFQTGKSDPDHLTIAWARELSQPAYWNGTYVDLSDAIAFAPGREFELRSPTHAVCVGISVPISRLASLDPDQPETYWAKVFAAEDCWTEARGQNAKISALLTQFLDNCSPASANECEAAFPCVLEAFFDHVDQWLDGSQTAGHKPLRLHSYPRIARRARAVMLERLDEALTVADVCTAVGCSRRALQYAFENVYDINPVAYLRNLRLNAVRKMLIQHRPGMTVQDVAAAHGFNHLPRFAQAYARMFGELPSQSLNRHH